MIDVLLDTLLDIVKLFPFLFLAFLIIELIEHKFSEKSKSFISSSGKLGPVIGGLLGAIPQCGFSVVATNLYVTRIISLGTLISIYLSTSDEMLPILLTSNVPITKVLLILSIKIIIGMIVGFIIDLIFRKTAKKDFHICEEDECDCEHSLIKSVVIHTLKATLFIAIITFMLNILFHYVGEELIDKIFLSNPIIAPFISSLIGLIPNCGASIAITELYINNVLSMGTLIGGLLTGSGVAILVLFKSNKDIKENLLILSLIYFIGVISGIIINIIGV